MWSVYTYYSSCVFGFHIVGSFLLGLFETLFSLFYPEKTPVIITISYHSKSQNAHRLIPLFEIRYFTIKNKDAVHKYTAGSTRLWSCGVWTQGPGCHRASSVTLNDWLSFTAWREQCYYTSVLRDKWSACWHWAIRIIYWNRQASFLCSLHWYCVGLCCMCACPYRWGLLSIVPLESKRKPAESELGWLPIAKGKE